MNGVGHPVTSAVGNEAKVKGQDLSVSEEIQTSPDVRVRVRESVIRVRVRDPAVSAIIGVTTHVQQLHVLLPFARRCETSALRVR